MSDFNKEDIIVFKNVIEEYNTIKNTSQQNSNFVLI